MKTPSLTLKSNQDLISDLKDLVAKEREVLLELLQHLKELEIRRLYLPMGYPSLFAYMTESLGFSEGAAQRRIQAMRLMKSMPEVAPRLKTGAISLSVASQVQGFIQRENQQRKQDKAPLLQSDEKLDLLKQLEGASSRECERQLARIAPENSLPPEKTRILTETKSLIQFVAGEELLAKFERLKALTSHSNPEGKYELLFERLAELGLDRLDPERKALRRESRRQGKREKRHHLKQEKPKSSSDPFPKPDRLKAPKSLPITQKSPGAWAPCGARAPGGSPGAKAADLPPDPIPPKPENPPPASAVQAGLFQSKQKLEKTAYVSMKNNDQGPLIKSNPQNSPAPIQNLKGRRSQGANRSRYIPQSLKDQIYLRDKGRCQHRDSRTDKICGSNYQLQFEHRYPFSLGGEHSEQNLRLYCKRHNQYRAELI